MSNPEKNYSYIAQLQAKMNQVAEQNMATLNSRSLKALIAWFESKQLDLSIATSLEDDPLQSAKLRGKVEILTDLAAEATSLIAQIAKADAPKAAPEEDDA